MLHLPGDPPLRTASIWGPWGRTRALSTDSGTLAREDLPSPVHRKKSVSMSYLATKLTWYKSSGYISCVQFHCILRPCFPDTLGGSFIPPQRLMPPLPSSPNPSSFLQTPILGRICPCLEFSFSTLKVSWAHLASHWRSAVHTSLSGAEARSV